MLCELAVTHEAKSATCDLSGLAPACDLRQPVTARVLTIVYLLAGDCYVLCHCPDVSNAL